MRPTRPALAAAVLILAQPAPADDQAVGPEPRTMQVIETLGLEQAPAPIREWEHWSPPSHVAVFIPPWFDDERAREVRDAVRQAAGEAEIVEFSSAGQLDRLAEVEALLGFCSPAVLAAAPKLRWMHSFSVGVERCTLDEGVAERDFVLTNNQRLSGPDIAEHAIAMMFALARNLDFYARMQQQGQWKPADRPSLNLDSRTLLVLGLGGIGTEIARRADALGMRVIATRNSSREGPDFVDYVGLSDETLALAGQADVIVNALPLTEATRGLADARFFEAARPGALYLSVGRGRTTDTEALVAALRSGRIGGAGLDVTDPEPLPADHPLWSMDNVVITPHVAADTDDANRRSVLIAVENLRRYVAGEALLSVVDFDQGY